MKRIFLIALAAAVAAGAFLFFLLSGSAIAVSFRGFLTQRLPRNIAEAGRPYGGERLLPPPVQTILGLLREHHVTAYTASRHLDRKGNIWLLVVASAWSIRADPAAPWYLARADEALPAGCHAVAEQEGITLARCLQLSRHRSSEMTLRAE
jgi:hypothetical protein